MDRPVVIAVGQTFADLAIEQGELDAVGAEVIDGRGLAADDPLWAAAQGILLGTAARMDAEALSRLDACKGIVRYGIGYDNVDVAAARAHGMAVGIVRDYCVEEVAEHALAFALSMARALPHWERSVRSGQWRGGKRPAVHRLSALTYGVVGFGLIGRAAAAKALGLFGTVLVHDAWVAPTAKDLEDGVVFAPDLETVLSRSDIVTVHLPLTPETKAMIHAGNIGLMKRGAYLINVSRGGIIEERAALDAVRDGTIAGAAFDTFEQEPISADHPFLAESGILLSPHAAWISDEAEHDLRRLAAADMARIIEGKPPSTAV